jgi:large subunit ribosomal protein L18
VQETRKEVKGKIAVGKMVGTVLAKKALEKNIQKVVFDRSGYIYHGRVKAVADGARGAGLTF